MSQNPERNSAIGIAVSVLAVFRAAKQLNGRVGAKASNLKRLRTESDEATINSPSLSRVRSVSLVRASGKVRASRKVETQWSAINGADIGSE